MAKIKVVVIDPYNRDIRSEMVNPDHFVKIIGHGCQEYEAKRIDGFVTIISDADPLAPGHCEVPETGRKRGFILKNRNFPLLGISIVCHIAPDGEIKSTNLTDQGVRAMISGWAETK